MPDFDNVVPLVRETKTSREAWVSWKKLFENVDDARKIYLRTWMYTTKMSEGQPITSYLADIKYLKEPLIAVDESITEKEMITVTIKGLLLSYQMFITGLTTAGRLATIGFEELRDMLLHHNNSVMIKKTR